MIDTALTRRRLLKLLGLGLAGCTDARRLLGPEHLRLVPGWFEPEHTAAAFEVGMTDAILSVWAPRARTALPVIEDVETGEQMVASEFAIRAESGGTGVGSIGGLAPGRQYRWHLRFDTDRTTDWYQLRTAPPESEAASLHLLYSADIDVNPIYDSSIFATMAASRADVYVSLGDWPYADNAPAASTVEEFRAKHREVRATAKVQPLLHAMSIRAMYDDHDAYDNWAGQSVPDPARLAAALTVWDEWFPLASTTRRYRSWKWGSLAEMWLLDTRLYRSDDAALDGPAKTMLGTEQRAWLINGVLASTAPFKLIFTTIPLDFGNTGDDWTVFRTERGLIWDALSGVRGIVFLSADQHWFAAHHHAAGFTEWQVGPLARSPRAPPAPVPGVVTRVTGVYNYGEITITGGASPELVFQARDSAGAVLYTEAVTP